MKKIIFLFFLLISFIGLSNAQYTKLLDFDGTTNGKYPYGSLFYDGTYLYGMTQLGGSNNMGTIFKIKPDGSSYMKLLDFSATTGSPPFGSLITDGTFLYGTTELEGINHYGTIFKIKPDGSSFAKLLDFAGNPDGKQPKGSLYYDGTFLYGMTNAGGIYDLGTVFRIKPDGNGYLKLLDFTGATNGKYPVGTFISYDTFLFGMTPRGGTPDSGTVFKIKPDGSGYTKLLNFAGTNGCYPYGSLVSDSNFLYGMTDVCGINDSGTIFKIKPDGSGYTKLLDFGGATNGSVPMSSLIYDGTFLYGMTNMGGIYKDGTVFKIKPDGSSYIKLLDFAGAANGSYPYGSLISDGTFLYGMTAWGGTNNNGVVFKLGINGSGINEINENNRISVYPNPVTNNISIEAPPKSVIKISDTKGQIIMTLFCFYKVTSCNLTDLSNGVYIVTVKTDKEIVTKKIIKE